MSAERWDASGRPAGARRVLLVEDDGNHRWVIRRLLENALGGEVAVEEAATGEEALERAAEGPPLDLVLLDLALPGIGGLEVLKQLRSREETKGLPVVVLTSSQEQKDVRSAYEYGANSYVSKSDSPERTMQRLRMLPFYWLELNRLPDSRPA